MIQLIKKYMDTYLDVDKSVGGFFDLSKQSTCLHLEHNPPTHLYVPPGKGYKHVCPDCGKETVIIPQQITF